MTNDTSLKAGYGKVWSLSVANDPKHRPQTLDRPATTVRREWSRWPQEAHLLDDAKLSYRRLSVEEISRIQGFDPSWVAVPDVNEKDQIAALGNAVPPPLAAAIGQVIGENWTFENNNSIEICAGIGGLTFASAAAGLEPSALIEFWEPACSILRHEKPWSSSAVFCSDARVFDYKAHKSVGMLLGGPPCQPWSQGGRGLGQGDARDLLGHVPQILVDLEPETFLLENVPGLYTRPAHREYLESLIDALGRPASSLTYGVAIGIFNAADYGVPQVRRRLFILGFKNRSAAFAGSIMQKIEASATHVCASKLRKGCKPWICLDEAFTGLNDPGGWKPLPKKELLLATSSILPNSTQQDQTQLSLQWPGKGHLPRVKDHHWQFMPPNETLRYLPLLRCEPHEAPSVNASAALVVHGDLLDALEALRPSARGRIDLVYHEAHRVDFLEKECMYPNYRNSIWLSILRECSARARHLLKQGGFYALQVDDSSYHYARLCLDEEFGASNYVCTIVWQKKYGPQNDLNVPTAAQEYIIVYSNTPAAELPVIGFQIIDDMKDDGDPRGPWVAGHKGAKSGSDDSKFQVNAPPYRWEIVSGQLPPGAWRLNPLSGVIWGKKAEVEGSFSFQVRVTDAAGTTAETSITVDVTKQTDVEVPSDVPWLFSEDTGEVGDHKLRVISPSKWTIRTGAEISIALHAIGGKPFKFGNGQKGKPGDGRYWEFSRGTLRAAVLRDDVFFGASGMALPSTKKHHSQTGRVGRIITWWGYEEFGKSEDASRHLNDMKNKGLIAAATKVAKPERLMKKLLELLAPRENARVLCLGDNAASMSSVCIKTGRQPITLVGDAPSGIKVWKECGFLRLQAVILGKDSGGISTETTAELRRTGEVLELEVGEPVFLQDQRDGFLTLNVEGYPPDEDRILEAVCSLAGFFVEPDNTTLGSNLDGACCLILKPTIHFRMPIWAVLVQALKYFVTLSFMRVLALMKSS